MEIHFDPAAVKVGEMRRLEKLRGFNDLADWFVKNCGVSEAEFDDQTLAELMQASADLQEKVKVSMALPKLRGSN